MSILLEFEARIVAQVLDIRQPPGEQVVDRDYGIPFAKKGIAEMRAEKSGSASYQGTQFCHDLLILLVAALSAGATGVAEGRPTL